MLDEYLTIRSQFLQSHHFLVGLKKCGRVTTTRITNSSFLIFLKQLRAHGGCLGSERRRRTW